MKTSRIELYINGAHISSFPIYSDKISIDKERESNEMFRRTKLSTTITFVGDDFQAIYDSGIDSSFAIKVYDEETNTFLARGTFEKTDCKFNLDDRICEVKISSADDYDKILKGKGNEYDIVALAPIREEITLFKRAILQIYIFHDTKITNVYGNTSYEVNVASGIDVDQLTVNDFITRYNFSQVGTGGIEANITNMPSSLSYLLGTYVGQWNGSNTVLTQEGGNNKLEIYGDSARRCLYWVFRDSSNNIVTYNGYYVTTEPVKTTPSVPDLNRFGYEVSNPYGGRKWASSSEMTTYGDDKTILARILLDYIPYGNAIGNVKDLLAEDICETNLNYHYSMEVSGISQLSGWIVKSTSVQDEPTKWGVNGEGKYFVQPSPISPNDNVIPIGWSRWIPKSIWLNSTTALSDILDMYDSDWEFKDAYPLWSVIQLLLKQIDPEITFNGTSAYSQFLYGTISPSVIYGYVKDLLYISPITNVKKTYYEQAARKGKLTLAQILDMLRNAYQLYWFIDSQKRLRIEHITWFKNGGTYSQSSPLVDLTSVKSPMSMKEWDFGKNTISYNKSSLIKRYEFGWDTQVTEAFDGYPIDIHNKFVGNGNTYKASIAKFISDIDMIMSAPKNFSDDAFAVIGVNSNKVCPIVSVGNYGMDFVAPTFKLQNGHLSFYNLELAYWTYDLGGDYASIGEFKNSGGDMGVLRVYDTKRVKSQSVKFPIDASKVGKEGLIRTSIGDGEWESAKYTPEDGMMEMSLILPTEDDMAISFGEFEGEGVTLERNGNTLIFRGNSANNGWGCIRVKFNRRTAITMVADSEADYDIGWANLSKMNSVASAKKALYSISGWQERNFTMGEGTSLFFGYIKDSSKSDWSDTLSVTFVVE